MTYLEKLADIARANPLVLSIRRMIESAMSAAAGAFRVALFAAPVYAMSASPDAASAPASTSAASTKPVGVTVFPGEIYRAPKSWTEKAYPTTFSRSDAQVQAAAVLSPPRVTRTLTAAREGHPSSAPFSGDAQAATLFSHARTPGR